MIEPGVHKKLKFRRRELRGDIRRDAKVCRIIYDADLVMWLGAICQLPVNRTASRYPISV